MGMVKLELRCPKSVNGLSLDPKPDWSFNELLSELNALEAKLNDSESPLKPTPFTKSPPLAIRGVETKERNRKGFVMRVADIQLDESDSDDETESRSLVPAGRFFSNDTFSSDSEDSEDEATQPLQVPVIHKTGVSESAFLELTHEHQLNVKEEMRNQVTTIEAQLDAINEQSTLANARIEKDSLSRREMDRKIDMHYQRKIAEALDNHLTAIQRDHEHRSQLVERRIRDDAAIEEAKRKEKHDEQLRQQKAKAEEEAKREAAERAEERRVAEEVERAKEAEKQAKDSAAAAEKTQNVPSTPSTADVPQSLGNLLRAAENALKLEERRLQNYKELEERNQSILSGSTVDLRPKEREIARRIKQISGSQESVRSRASDFLTIFNDAALPQSLTVTMFGKKVISIYETPNANFNTSSFAFGHVIVLVSAQVPVVMDSLLAEFHKVCMYTVPKHIVNSKSVFQTKERYCKAIGFREENGILETTEQYLERLRSYMKLYGAIVQTEVQGVPNKHGLTEGWTWLAWFVNALPANMFTGVALEAFLRMAGFALHKKYKDQFRKIINVISREFVPKLKARPEPEIKSIVTRLQDYLESNKFLEEPEGWRLKLTLESHNVNFDSQDDGGHQYQQSSYRPQQQYQQSNTWNNNTYRRY